MITHCQSTNHSPNVKTASHAFHPADPKLWNNLPTIIKSRCSYNEHLNAKSNISFLPRLLHSHLSGVGISVLPLHSVHLLGVLKHGGHSTVLIKFLDFSSYFSQRHRQTTISPTFPKIPGFSLTNVTMSNSRLFQVFQVDDHPIKNITVH